MAQTTQEKITEGIYQAINRGAIVDMLEHLGLPFDEDSFVDDVQDDETIFKACEALASVFVKHLKK